MELKRLDFDAAKIVDASASRLMARLKSSLSEALGYPVDDADPWVVVVASLMPYFVQNLAAADVAAKSTNLAFACGETLEVLAAGHGLERLDARAATVTVFTKISTGTPDAGSFDCLFELKELVISSGDVDFKLRDYRFALRDADAWLALRLNCQNLGSAYNGLSGFTVKKFDYTSSRSDGKAIPVRLDLALDINPNNQLEPICSVGGQKREGDDELAHRIFREIRASNAAGSADYYRAAAMRVPGIIDARVLSRAEVAAQWAPAESPDNLGDVVILPLAEESGRGWAPFIGDVPVQTSANEALVEAVREVVEGGKIVGTKITVMPAYGLLTMITGISAIRYYLYEEDIVAHGLLLLQQRIEDALKKYIHWQCDSLSVPFSIGQAAKGLLEAGAAKVEVLDADGALANVGAYAEMKPLLFAPRKYQRIKEDDSFELIDSITLQYGGTVKKIFGGT